MIHTAVSSMSFFRTSLSRYAALITAKIATLQIRNRQIQNRFQGKTPPRIDFAQNDILIITKIPTYVKKGGYELNREKRKRCFEKLNALAKSRNVTFYKLSEELDIPRSTFSDWKSGKSMPKTDKLIRIAEYFGVNVCYFVE